MFECPIDWSDAPESGAGHIGDVMNLVPSPLWRKMRRTALIRDITPKALCRQVSGGENVYWMHDWDRGVLVSHNASDDSVGIIRLKPASVGTVTGSASSTKSGSSAANAFDGSAATDWRANSYTVESWLQGALAAAANVDSVKVTFTEAASGSSSAQSYIRGIRIRPNEHEDTTKTCATICEELVAVLVAHSINRAYVFASTHAGFFFDNGQADFIPIGSDDGDFLKEFITAATAESIEVYASLFYLVSPTACVANDWHLEYENGGNYNNYWMCVNKVGVTAWMTSMIAILTTDSDYSSLTGIDFAEPQFGFPWQKLCFCSECRAAFETAEPDATFGKITTTTPSRVTATGTAWEVWRAGTMTTALCAHIKEVNDAGLNSQVTSFYGIDAEYGEQLDLEWKAILEGLDTDAILDDTNKPTEWGWQMTWQEKASSKDYTSFGPENTEAGVRWALALTNGRATPVVHIGAYGTNDGSTGDDPDFAYGYDHTLTAAELQEAFEAAMRGGAIHLEGYALHTYQNPADSLCATDIWDGWDDAIAGTTYNSILCEVQYNDSGTWRPIGEQAWFRTRGSGTDHLAHFARMSEDQLRIKLNPAPGGDREVYIKEAEFRTHSVQSTAADATDYSNLWGCLDFDNHASGTDDLWAVRYTSSQAYMDRIDETTGDEVSEDAFDNYDVQADNALCVLPTGSEPRLLVLGQGQAGTRARLQRYSTAAPGTLVSTVLPYLGGYKTKYGGIASQPSSVDGTAYLVIAINTAHHGPRFYWADPSTLAESDHADSEINWFWANSLCWMGATDDDFLFGENSFGGFVMRPVGRLTEDTAASAQGNVVTWDEAEITLELHPEKTLHLSSTSLNTPWRICCYVWDNEGTYLAPSVAAYGVAADDVETSLGTLSEENSWGNVRLLSLFLGRDLAQYQRIKFVATRAAGATYIGILEVGVNMAVTRGNIVDGIALGVHDSDMDDHGQAELREIANDAYCETVVAGRTHKEDVPLTLVEDQVEYSAEPCFEVTMVALGGQSLDHVADGDPLLASWDSDIPGIPDAYRQETGAKIRVNPKPSAAALGMIGDIEEAPTSGGTNYEVGDILTIVQSGASGGQVKVAAVDDDGVVTKLELIMRDRSTRGSAYSVESGLATTSDGDGADCTVEIATLAKLEVTGYSGVSRPSSDDTTLIAIPEHLIRASVIPLGVAKALENRRTGTMNLELARDKRKEWLAAVTRMDSSLRGV